jgi:tetratricopeptide (TPR) repeat protein
MFAVFSISRQSLPWYDELIMPARSVLSVLFLLSAVSLAVAGQTPPNEKEQIAHHERLAQQYLREQRPDLAIPELEKIVALDPNNVEACANLGVLLFFQRRYNDAVPQLRKAVELNPTLWKIQALLGLGESYTSDFADARKDLETSFPQIQEKKLKIEVGLELVGSY